MYLLTHIEHAITEESDHLALVVKVAAEPPRQRLSTRRGFMFEEMWLKHEKYEEICLARLGSIENRYMLVWILFGNNYVKCLPI